MIRYDEDTNVLMMNRAELKLLIDEAVGRHIKVRAELLLEAANKEIQQLRSALQSEQKPEEPKTVVLGPDTPLGWYKVCDKDATGKEQYNYLRDKVELVEHGFIDDKTVAIFRSPVGHFSLRYGIGLIEPVAPSVPALKDSWFKDIWLRGCVWEESNFSVSPPAPDQSEATELSRSIVNICDDTTNRLIARVNVERLLLKTLSSEYQRGRSDLKAEYEAKMREVKG